MERKKNDILKKLIQKFELDKPTVNFTESVMKEILVEANQEVVINAKVKSLLKRNAIDKPPMDFTNGVMTQVKSLEARTKYKPVITQKAWRIIFTVFACLVLGVSISDSTATVPEGLTSYFVQFGDMLNTIFGDANGSLYLTTIFSTGLLLLTDYVLKIKGRARVKHYLAL
jgi:hypothetical protein